MELELKERMVMRARDSVYHLSCFTCTTCHKTLTTGDHFGMKDSVVYCRAHFESLLRMMELNNYGRVCHKAGSHYSN
uniref:LIM zinc-binding domain-containing protein n=1 Tax=Anolis carolinensis TaxID=28377 RepID=A0A803T4I2_ANOCA